MAVTEAMAEPLNARFERSGRFDADTEALLAEHVPWASLATYAEGSYAALELSTDGWRAAADRSEGDDDDAFVALVTTAYDNASARGWPRWLERTWDYGGCSTFGRSDLHRSILDRTHALRQLHPVTDVVATIRDRLMEDLLKPEGDGEFPYCDGSDPTPTADLVAAAEALLTDVELSTAEGAALRGRIATRFGRP